MTGNKGLPQGWKFLPITKLAMPGKNSIKRGPFGSAVKKEYFVPKGYKIYEQKCVINNDFSLGHYYIDEERFQTLQGFEVKAGDVLITGAGTIGKIAVFPRNAEPGIINQALIKITLNDEVVSTKYFIYLFKSKVREIILSNTRGSAMQNISSVRALKEMLLPIPPRHEQERIVTKIEETFTQLEAGVVELGNAKAQLKRYRAAVLKSAVEGELTREWREAHQGEVEPAEKLLARILSARRERWESEGGKGKYKEPVTPETDGLPELPEGWIWTTVNAIAHSMKNGIYKPKEFYSEDGIACLRMYNIENGVIVWKDIKRMILTDEELATYLLESKDILVNRVNSRELVGKSAVIPDSLEPSVYESKNIRLRLRNNFVESTFINYWFRIYSQGYFDKNAQQTVGMASINQSQLGSMPVPLAPLFEQQRIIEKVERRLSVADEIEKELDESLVRAERLRGSVLKNAFEGRL